LILGKILIRCMYAQRPEKLRTYQEVGRAAFGDVGYKVTLVFQNLTLLFVGTLFLILGGVNIKLLFDAWLHHDISVKFYILGTAVLVWPFIVGLKTMKEISWIAVVGMLSTTFTVIIICIYSVLIGNKSSDHEWVAVESYPYAFSTFVFAFGGHNVFPAIQDSMRTKKKF